MSLSGETTTHRSVGILILLSRGTHVFFFLLFFSYIHVAASHQASCCLCTYANIFYSFMLFIGGWCVSGKLSAMIKPGCSFGARDVRSKTTYVFFVER